VVCPLPLMFTAGGVAGEPVTAGAALWRRGGKVCDGLAPAAAGFRGQAFGGAAGVFFLPGVPGVQDPNSRLWTPLSPRSSASMPAQE
jgi:hypothetical protein